MLNQTLLQKVFLPSQDAHHSGIHFAPLGKYFLLFDGQRLEKDDAALHYAIELQNNFSSAVQFKAVYLLQKWCAQLGLLCLCFPQLKHSPVCPKGKRTRMLQIQAHKGVRKHNNQVVQQTRPQAVSYCPLGDKDSSLHGITQVTLFLLVPHIRLLLLIPRTEKRCLYFKSKKKKKLSLQNTF